MKREHFKILIVDDEQEYRDVMQMILRSKGFTVEMASGVEEAMKALDEKEYDLVLSDLIMKGKTGIDLLEEVKNKYPEIEVIIFTGYGSVKNAIEAIRKGAFSYFIKSHDPEELLIEINKLIKVKYLKNQNALLKEQNSSTGFMLNSNSESFKRVLRVAKKAAVSNVNVLILGESGVGKEVFARYIHQYSQRAENSFVPVNCHAFSESLLESELFGHEKGAFTGALEAREGRFEAAEEGTLFLDEIGETSQSTQVKLLRSLENKRIERLGSNRVIDVDFRLICATNRNLKEMILDGDFREDLYYRISTIVIEIPPLRERKEDLNQLIDYFIEKSSVELKKKIMHIDDDVLKFLLNYDYPGNVRELKNLIERLIVLSDGGKITREDLPELSTNQSMTKESEEIRTLKEVRNSAEQKHIKKVLSQCNNNLTQTSDKLGISRRQLFNKMTEYGMK